MTSGTVPSDLALGFGISPQAASAPSGYTPQQIIHAYGLDNLVQNGTKLNGNGQTIAIVDANDDPTIATDLQAFSQAFGLPAAAFTKSVYGGTPIADSSAAMEIALDVEWAHAIAPGASILLVEAASSNQVYSAAAWAAQQPGVSVVSMSFGQLDSQYENTMDGNFTTPTGHQGVTFVAASGDRGVSSGYPASSPYAFYPADSPNVIGVGATSLTTDANGNYVSEAATSYSGGGYSLYEVEPSYQTNAGVKTPNNMRASPDVSMVGGDGTTGVPIYDSYTFGSSTPWQGVFGTSASTPMFAGLIALANQGRALAGKATLDGPNQTLPLLYQLRTSFHDITTGGNSVYQATAGYDFVSGLGTPIGNVLVPQLIQGGFMSLAGQGGFTVNASPGTAFSNQEVAAFSDPNGNLSTNMYSASINWGDGSAATTGTIGFDSQGRLAVLGGHTYANAGSFTITVAISSNRTGAPAATTVQSTASVTSGAILPLSASGGFPVNATSGTAFSNQEVATFSDPNGTLATSNYSGAINWGDGTANSAGVVSTDSQGRLAVFGGHTYSTTGNFTITITVSSARTGAPAGTNVQSTATVTAAAVLPLSASGGFSVNATSGTAFSNQELATFSDPNGALATSNYSGAINWGDGTANSTGVVSTDSQGRLAVFGGHTYASAGNFTITITVSSARTGGTNVQSTATVAAAAILPLSANGGFAIFASRGCALDNLELATFSDPNGVLATSNYSGTINWGDGSAMTAGVIATDLKGQLAVFGGHTYAGAGNFTITVTISSARTGAPAGTSVQSSASIASLPTGLTPTEYYITWVYDALLGRTPSASERQGMEQQLNAGISRLAFVNAIDHCDEYFHTLIDADYLKYLGRAVDAAGEAYWTSQMKAGLTDESLEALFVASGEYYAHSGGTDLDWVNHMYLDILGRAADPTGQANWIQFLAAGGSRRQVAFGFATSPERESQHIERNYEQYLGRSADPSGLQHWLYAFLHGQTNEDLISGFLASDEYFQTHS